MVTITTAVMAIGYTLFYVGGSNLAHGPGKGVGFTEALGLNAGTSGPVSKTPPAATGAKRATAAAAAKPGTGGSKAKP